MGAATVLSGKLPDPGDPSIVPLLALVGGFLGAVIARARGLDRNKWRRATEDGAFAGTVAGLVMYLTTLAAGL